MGQTKSKDCADKKGTDNLSDQDVVKHIKILKELAKKEGPMAVSAFIDESLNKWETERVTFGITGCFATGKSTFLNTIRNLKATDDGFARSGSGDSTTSPTFYLHPTNDKIGFYDLPGYSSATFKKADYISKMNIADLDVVLIFYNNVLGENEIWLVGELRKLGKPFALVRSKLDLDIDNARYDGKDENMLIPEIKEKNRKALKENPELMDTKGIFLISGRNPEMGEWSDLMVYIEESIGGIKAQALLFSLASITKEIVERKYKMLKKRMVKVTASAAGIALIPVPGLDVIVNTTLLIHEVQHYMSVFGVNRKSAYSLKDFDHSLLKCTSLLKPTFNMFLFVCTKIGTMTGLVLATSFLDLIIPLVGSIISSVATATVTYKFLDNMLQDLHHDAILINEHILKTNAYHRM